MEWLSTTITVPAWTYYLAVAWILYDEINGWRLRRELKRLRASAVSSAPAHVGRAASPASR